MLAVAAAHVAHTTRLRCSQVRKAYKRLALQLHPDRALGPCRWADRLGPAGSPVQLGTEPREVLRSESNWLFKLVSEAHEVLCDPRQRQELDGLLGPGLGAYGARGHDYYNTASGRGWARPRDGGEWPPSASRSWGGWSQSGRPYAGSQWGYF